jgi:hypothetical protein
MSIRVFELPEIAEILEIELAKAKNWTNGRTGLEVTASVRPAGGTGKSALYSLQDLYLLAVSAEFSKAGFASKAIGKLAETVKPLVAKSIPPDTVWTVWRVKSGGPFRIETGQQRPPKTLFWHTLEIGSLLTSVDAEIAAFALRRERELKARKKDREQR